MTDWFEEWFGEEYLSLYPHRDDEEALQVSRLIAETVEVGPEARALDLGCGAGRHTRALMAHWWTVGLDLSPALLHVARSEVNDAPFTRADMRSLPFHDGAFDVVVNLFTSFGYFRDDAHHAQVIREVARVTRRGGWFVIDFLNAPYVRKSLIPYDQRQVGSRIVEQEREISPDGRYVRKTITLSDEGRTFIERVRLFEPEELQSMLEDSGFEVAAVFGGYDGAPLCADSPRAVLAGRRI